MVKTTNLESKLFLFVLALMFLCSAFGVLSSIPAVAAAAPVTVTAAAGNGVQMGYWLGDGGPATDAGIAPVGVAVDVYGNLYIADKSNNRIRKVNTAGIITTVAGNGTEGNSGDGSPATSAELAEPCGVAVDTEGNLYIADSMNGAIRKVDSNGIIITIAGEGLNAGMGSAGYSGYSGDGSPATSAELGDPVAIAVDAAGDIYIADQSHIREVAAVTAIQYGISMTVGNIYTVAGNGGPYEGHYGDGGAATSAELGHPDGVAVDAAGNIYISDQDNNRIRKVNTAGIITTVAGGGAIQGFFSNWEPATSVAISNPDGVAVDAAGNLYIADGLRISKMDTTKGTIITVAGKGTNSTKYLGGYSGDGGPATDAELFGPLDVAVDSSGNLYIADSGNNRIRKVDIDGIITTVAGNGSTIASGQESAIFTVGQRSYTLGEQSYAMDASPFISDGRALVPASFLADALGAQTQWDTTAQKVTITRVIVGYTVVELTIGSTAMEWNYFLGDTAWTPKTIQMEVAPVILDGRTYLPARYIAEAFGLKVSWGAAAQTISVSQQST